MSISSHTATGVPAFNIKDTIDGIVCFEDNKEREITTNIPLYSEVKELYIGLQQTSTISKATPYKNGKHVVFYGSSITQGAALGDLLEKIL